MAVPYLCLNGIPKNGDGLLFDRQWESYFLATGARALSAHAAPSVVICWSLSCFLTSVLNFHLVSLLQDYVFHVDDYAARGWQ